MPDSDGLDRITCADCGHVLREGPPDSVPPELTTVEGERTPCPNCGSTARGYEASFHAQATATASASATVTRGVNTERLAVVGFITATSIGIGALTCALIGLATGIVLVVILAWPRTRHLLMEGVHRISGQ